MVKKIQKIKFKKAPGAPKRFKSAYMFFSENQHKVFRANAACKKMRTADVAKLVSQAWKELPDADRALWLEMGKRDRERYDREKATYQGPWKIPDIKDPHQPKKPQTAFLAFSNERRKLLLQENPHLSGTEISLLLAALWKECPVDIQNVYRAREVKERDTFQSYQQRKESEQGGVPSLLTGDEEAYHPNYATVSQSTSVSASSTTASTAEDEQYAPGDLTDQELGALWSTDSNPPAMEPTPIRSNSLAHQLMSMSNGLYLLGQNPPVSMNQVPVQQQQQQPPPYSENNNITTNNNSSMFNCGDFLPNGDLSYNQIPQEICLPVASNTQQQQQQPLPCLSSVEQLDPLLVFKEQQQQQQQPSRQQYYAAGKTMHKDMSLEHYTMDDILQDETLFEDFSPAQVVNVPLLGQQNQQVGGLGGVDSFTNRLYSL